MKNRWLWIGSAMIAVAALALTVVLSFGGFGKEFSQAQLQVSNLTCASCVAKIEEALAGMNGVGKVEVNVIAGVARVNFEPAAVTPEAIAQRIAAAGYPAQVARVLSAAEVKALRGDDPRPRAGCACCG